MQVWAEFYCDRCQEQHRIAFNIVAYRHYIAQHRPCPEGWQPPGGVVCIHDYAIRVHRARTRGRRSYTKKGRISSIYAGPDCTVNTMMKWIRAYVLEHYNVAEGSLRVEIDFT